MWTRLQNQDQLLELQEELKLEVAKEPSPTCLRVYGSVRAVLAGTIPEEILVDDWPKWSVIVVRPISSSNQKQTQHLLRTISIHCRSVPSVQPEVSIEDAVDWTRPCTFACLPVHTATTVTRAAAAHGSLVKLIDCETLIHQNDTFLERPIPIPEQYASTTVLPSMARTVVSHWRQDVEKTPAADDTAATDLVEYNSANFPSSCIVDAVGTPVAHVLCHYYGAVGMLGLSREHKGHGLAALVLHDLCRKLKALQQPIWAHVEKGNLPAAELFYRTGFSLLRGAATVWLEFTPHSTPPGSPTEVSQSEKEGKEDTTRETVSSIDTEYF